MRWEQKKVFTLRRRDTKANMKTQTAVNHYQLACVWIKVLYEHSVFITALYNKDSTCGGSVGELWDAKPSSSGWISSYDLFFVFFSPSKIYKKIEKGAKHNNSKSSLKVCVLCIEHL